MSQQKRSGEGSPDDVNEPDTTEEEDRLIGDLCAAVHNLGNTEQVKSALEAAAAGGLESHVNYRQLLRLSQNP